MAASQEKIRVYCTGKERDKTGKVVAYELINQCGITGTFDKNYMRDMLKKDSCSYYECINLQLDRLGRIVDKAIPNEKETIEKLQKLSKIKDKNTIFEQAYCFIAKEDNKIVVCHSNGKMKLEEPFDRIENIDINTLEKEFEAYLLQKHNYKPTKFKVVNPSHNYEYIVWGSAYIDSSLVDDTGVFIKYDNINNFKISCNYNSSTHEVYKKVASIYDKNTGRIIENAFCGLIIYDRNHEGAVNWAKKNIKKLENTVKKISQSNKTSGVKGGKAEKADANKSLKSLKSMQSLMKQFNR